MNLLHFFFQPSILVINSMYSGKGFQRLAINCFLGLKSPSRQLCWTTPGSCIWWEGEKKVLTDLHCTRAETGNPDVADVLSSSSHQLRNRLETRNCLCCGSKLLEGRQLGEIALEGPPWSYPDFVRSVLLKFGILCVWKWRESSCRCFNQSDTEEISLAF